MTRIGALTRRLLRALPGAVVLLAVAACPALADSYSVELQGPASVHQGSPAAPGSVTFRIVRDQALRAGTIHYETVNASATGGRAGSVAPVDYVATSGTATFAAGEDHVDVTVALVGEDAAEGPEHFSLVISRPAGGVPDDSVSVERAGVDVLSDAPIPCQDPIATGSRIVTFSVNGLQRSMLLHVPPGQPPDRRLPLVLAFHGFRSDGPGMERYTGLSALADRDGFVVAYPSAPGGQWHPYAGQLRSPADVAFVRVALNRLNELACVDRRRRFATGVSNGAGEVARVACDLGDRLAGVAMVAGDYRSLPACATPRPVSVLEIHGTSDPVVPYYGRGPEHRGGVPWFVAMWRLVDHCERHGQRYQVGRNVVRRRWHCGGGTRVEQVTIRALGHAWPGAMPARGTVPGLNSAGFEIARFFHSLSLRPSGKARPDIEGRRH